MIIRDAVPRKTPAEVNRELLIPALIRIKSDKCRTVQYQSLSREEADETPAHRLKNHDVAARH
jgi:hypothetical protein